MKYFNVYILILAFLFPVSAFAQNFHLEEKNDLIVSPYAFQTISDFFFWVNREINPEDVFEGAIVFAQANEVGLFINKYHSKIKNRYVLLTHGKDCANPGKYFSLLDDPKLIAWFSINPSIDIQAHGKFFPIPLGLRCRSKRGNDIFMSILREIEDQTFNREHLVYLNLNIDTCKDQRKYVYDLYCDKEYCFCKSQVPYEEYLTDLKISHFVFSPRGRGLDCFRNWESIVMGSIPIVKTSFLDPLFEGLPVLVVQDWDEINEDFLWNKLLEINLKEVSFDKLFISYWKKYIDQIIREAGVEKS